MPARKLGTATPTWLNAEISVPVARRCHTAASTPSGSATTSAIAIPQSTSHIVTSSRSTICGPTSTWVT
jgi:hypothetical protein